MIISRTPFRVSFFGGGTDYPAWYRQHGGAVLGTTINKYCYLACRYLPPFFEHRIRVEREEDRRRVGKTSGLDDDPAKPSDLAGIASFNQAAQGSRQVFADGAAQATPGQLEYAALDEVDEVMIDRDLADLVDDNGGVGQFWRDQRPAQQGCLAAAEKARQQGCRQGLRFRHAINHSMTVTPVRIVSRGRRGGKSRHQIRAPRLPRPLHSLVCVSSMPAIRVRHE